jgi:hypothetical protein
VSAEIIPLLASLEEDPALHQARLLLLLDAFAGSRGTDHINGLTKLAKLDFLLRYPTYLERALFETGRDGTRVDVQDHERTSVESSMVRYRYGPWDFRYRQLVDLLVCRGLAWAEVKGRTVQIGVTEEGREAGKLLSATEEFAEVRRRAGLLPGPFRAMGATRLKDFVYSSFPEIVTMRLGELIRP